MSAMVLILHSSPFVVDATTEASYTVDLSREALRSYVDDIGLFARNMPGVVSVTRLGSDEYLYETEKEIPLKGMVYTTFRIRKTIVGDSLTIYRSSDVNDRNYMSCQVQLRPSDTHETSIAIKLRIRLTRDDPADVHWIGYVLGADFISDRMADDMKQMLTEFIENSNKELMERLSPQSVSSN